VAPWRPFNSILGIIISLFAGPVVEKASTSTNFSLANTIERQRLSKFFGHCYN